MSFYAINRQRSISPEIERLLNEQYTREIKASFLYLSIGSWSESQGFSGAASFFYAHANEEREHGLRILRYINESGGQTIINDITNTPNTFDSLHDVVHRALDHELFVSQSIYELVQSAQEANDYTTVEFLNWFLKEQREEEALARQACEIANQVKGLPTGDYLLNKNLEKLSASAHGES